MTSLEILALLKSTRDNTSPAVLWIHHARRVAAVHLGGGAACCVPVAYNAAKVAATDPALDIIDRTDGDVFAA